MTRFLKSTSAQSVFLSLLSGILLSLGWLGVSGLFCLVGFVPLLILSGRAGRSASDFWKIFGCVALSFGLWSGLTTWWIWYASALGPIFSVLITILLFGGVFMAYHYSSKRAPKAVVYCVLIAGWISAEYLYTVGQVSFPWLVLGNGLASDVRLVQWYEYTGVFGGSLWILTINVLAYQLFIARKRALKSAFLAVAIVIPVVVSLMLYYTYKDSGKTATVTVVQPNIDPYSEKFAWDQSAQSKILTDLIEQSPATVDFVVMPETAIDDGLWEEDLTTIKALEPFRELLRTRQPHSQFIMGATTYRRYNSEQTKSTTARTLRDIPYWFDIYNSALAVDSSSVVDLHHKSKLVVGVEKMPFPSLTKYLDFLIVDLGGTTGQLGYDSVRRVFTSPSGIRTGTAICYESVYGSYFSEFVRGGAQLMFVITNDGWWGDTAGYHQHFSFSRLRAIETRHWIARSANTGISGIINGRGDVVQKIGWDVRSAITGSVHLSDTQTFYTRTGDYVARLSVLVFVLSILYYMSYRVRKP